VSTTVAGRTLMGISIVEYSADNNKYLCVLKRSCRMTFKVL